VPLATPAVVLFVFAAAGVAYFSCTGEWVMVAAAAAVLH
jgi:hypothetical protein